MEHSTGKRTEKEIAQKTLRKRGQKYNYIQKQCPQVRQNIKMPE
jgi:hypothetical protein